MSMGAKDHWDVANFDPMGMVGRIYVGALFISTYNIYINRGLHGVREDLF